MGCLLLSPLQDLTHPDRLLCTGQQASAQHPSRLQAHTGLAKGTPEGSGLQSILSTQHRRNESLPKELLGLRRYSDALLCSSTERPAAGLRLGPDEAPASTAD